jgi:hypothetical protein
MMLPKSQVFKMLWVKGTELGAVSCSGWSVVFICVYVCVPHSPGAAAVAANGWNDVGTKVNRC